MRPGKLILLAAGLSLLAILAVWQGVSELLLTFGAGGWPLLALAVFVVPDILAAGLSWRALFTAPKPPLGQLIWASWMGLAVNALLPVITVGGEVARARQMIHRGVPAIEAAAATLVEKTIQAATIVVWGGIGLMTVAIAYPGQTGFWPIVGGAALIGLGVAIFVGLQVRGAIGRASGWASKLWPGSGAPAAAWSKSISGGQAFDGAVRNIYRQPGSILLALVWRILGRLSLVGELMVAAMLLGDPLTLTQAVALRGLASLVRGAAFAVPGGLGLQEGGYIAIGALIGVPPPLALALSLATRIREIVPNLPVLIAWQFSEGRHLASRQHHTTN